MRASALLLHTIIALLAGGCLRVDEKGASAVAATDSVPSVRVVDSGDGATSLTVIEEREVRFRKALSDSPVIEVSIEQRKLDFDCDGTPEFVIYVWEGQNSGDRAFIVGKRYGKWSVWHSFYRPSFETAYRTNDGCVSEIVVTDQTNGSKVAYVYRDGEFHTR